MHSDSNPTITSIMAEMRSATPWIAILFSFCYSVEWKLKKIPADDDIYFSVVDFIFVTVKVNDIFISVEDLYLNILYVDTIYVLTWKKTFIFTWKIICIACML